MKLQKYSFIAIAIFIVLYFILVNIFTVNFPVMDDYLAILEFTNDFVQADSIQDKIGLIYEQHNTHIMVMPRLIFLMQYYLFGEINFKVLIFIGNLFLLGIFYLIYLAYKKADLVKYIFIPFLLIFNLIHWENSFWAIASIATYTYAFFALAAFYFITRKETLELKDFLLSLAFSIFALYSFGGGVVVMPIIIMYLLFFKRNKFAYLYIAISFILLLAYFSMDFESGFKIVSSGYDKGMSSNILHVIAYFFAFTGHLGLFLPSAYFMRITVQRKFIDPNHHFFYLVCLQILALGVLAIIMRSGYSLLQGLFSSRYLIYPILFYIVLLPFILKDKLYLKLGEILSPKKLFLLTTIIMLLIVIMANLQGIAMMKYRWYLFFLQSPQVYSETKETFMYYEGDTAGDNDKYYFGFHAEQDSILQKSAQLNIFNPNLKEPR